ncbi:hypothetical protein CDD81_5090 [Ophiocordyceps australis]|uniref:Carrier domain-containing protein n=1 Tax=Ophiocordyceps australis TaxID=1399860 RepID=A0A2C5Y3C5_9HYPO|nr:hypothetical protein CDD81_5090 [Ophiocordyceps australis]
MSPVSTAIKSPPTACPEPVEHDATYGRVLKIIADEVRIDLSRLQPDCLFADLGLDSLLSLTVTSRINDEMGTSLPPSLFARYPSVKDLRALLDAPLTDMPPDTPELLSGSHSVTEESRASTSAASDDESLSFVVRQAIATQTGMPAQELMPDALLAQLGVDSLLSLSIADSVTQALGAEVSSKHFLDHETLGDMEAALGKALGLVAAAGADTVTKDALVTGEAIIAPGADTATPDADTTVTPDADLLSAPPHATSILLHRPAAPAHASRANLFLLPDGSGSAASYAALAKLDAALTVYGINCPWRTAPLDMSQLGVTTRQVVAKFVAEMRRLQPHGPYLLGGWSAGGIFAYEAVRHLMAAGQRVDQLLLIDAPNPVGLENPPPRMFDFFQRSGVFANMGSGKTVPPWLRHHFESVVDMLDSYKPQPLPSPPPPTLVVYARDGVCKDPSAPQMETSPDDAREMLWLLHNRTDFSASGWASLLGPDSLTVCVLDHVNHFTMMNDGPHMDTMRHHARRAIMAAGS